MSSEPSESNHDWEEKLEEVIPEASPESADVQEVLPETAAGSKSRAGMPMILRDRLK